MLRLDVEGGSGIISSSLAASTRVPSEESISWEVLVTSMATAIVWLVELL